MKVLNIGIRYSRMWHLADSPNKVSLTPDQIREIYQAIEEAQLPISFDGWSFDTDVNYQLNFAILRGGTYYCFSRVPEEIIPTLTQHSSEWTGERAIKGVNKNSFTQDGNWIGSEGFNSPSWRFTTYHDSCWRDGAFRNIEKCDNRITHFIYELGKKYNIPELLKYNTPNFTNIETMRVYPLIRFMRGYEDLYRDRFHYFYKGKDEAVFWVDLSSQEFKDHVSFFLKDKPGFNDNDFKFENPESGELAVSHANGAFHIFTNEELKLIFDISGVE